MDKLEIKNIATLIDELITAEMKSIARPTHENTERYTLLLDLINFRLGKRWELISEPYTKLRSVLKECWDAQEVVMYWAKYGLENCTPNDMYLLAEAAILAQTTNVERNKLVREIDTILGETDSGHLEKTYA